MIAAVAGHLKVHHFAVAAIAAIAAALQLVASATPATEQKVSRATPQAHTSRQPASSAASAAGPSAQGHLLTDAMWAGIKSDLAPMPAEAFAHSYERWASMAFEVLDGGKPDDAQRLGTSKWTETITYLRVNARTVLFAALVEYQGPLDAAKTRRVMPIVAQASESGQMLVASVDGIPGLTRPDRYLQAWPTANAPINLASPDFARMRAQIEEALSK